MHAWLIARMFNFSRGNACVSQSNSFHASLTAPALANQIAFMLTSEEREAQKKRWWTKLRTGVKAKKNPEPELFFVCGREGVVPWHGHIRSVKKQTNKQTNI